MVALSRFQTTARHGHRQRCPADQRSAQIPYHDEVCWRVGSLRLVAGRRSRQRRGASYRVEKSSTTTFASSDGVDGFVNRSPSASPEPRASSTTWRRRARLMIRHSETAASCALPGDRRSRCAGAERCEPAWNRRWLCGRRSGCGCRAVGGAACAGSPGRPDRADASALGFAGKAVLWRPIRHAQPWPR